MRHLPFLLLLAGCAGHHTTVVAPQPQAIPVPGSVTTLAPRDVAGPPPDATLTASGLGYKVLVPGTGGVHPGPEGTVTVHYSGWTTDGTLIDSSALRGEPISFPMNRVIAGWQEGVQRMVEGEIARLWIPEELAYGGRDGAPQGMLVFDVHLIDIAAIPEAPLHLSAPDPRATVTPSGLAYLVLSPGTGMQHPGPNDRVTVHYSGWTSENGLFDSSLQRATPATFPVSGVVPGWQEVLQLMVVGEKIRAWIPPDLAYRDQPGKPQGLMVFDIELLGIK